MRETRCPRSEALAAATARRPLSAEERGHARGCDDCAAELASAASRALARELSASARLPSARQTLLRARLEARRRAAERPLRPLQIWQGIVLAAGVAGALRFAPALGGALTDGAAALPEASPAGLLLALGLAALALLPAAAHRRRGAA
jgi:hypothetical protein